MNTHAPSLDLTAESRGLRRALNEYRAPRRDRSVAELAVTAVPFAALWMTILIAVRAGFWPGLLLALPAAAFLVRLFIIQHDCSHGSFFRSRPANDWVGRVIGVLTLTPHDFWRRTHATHHASVGNVDRPRTGGVNTLTVDQYRALSPTRRLLYRLYRHPAVMFGLGPAYIFLLDHRLPVGSMRGGWMPWLSTMGTNAAIGLLVVGTMRLVDVSTFVLVQLPISLLAGAMGIWLFYVQHQFERTYWEHDGDWTARDAALHGSSHFDLPVILRWFTVNIGVHHVHHLCCRIPSYRLPEVLRDHPELRDVNRITLRQSLKTLNLALWDEDTRRLVSFRDGTAVRQAPRRRAAHSPGRDGWSHPVA